MENILIILIKNNYGEKPNIDIILHKALNQEKQWE